MNDSKFSKSKKMEGDNDYAKRIGTEHQPLSRGRQMCSRVDHGKEPEKTYRSVPKVHVDVMAAEKRLHYSRQREKIYEYLLTTKEHPSADMVFDALREDVKGLSLGTVYRNLKLLEELGKVRRVTNHQGIERYDTRCDDHVHFLCEGCGCIDDVDDTDTKTLRKVILLGKDYRPTTISLTITGLCPQCCKLKSDEHKN